jgi:hypothetical protein
MSLVENTDINQSIKLCYLHKQWMTHYKLGNKCESKKFQYNVEFADASEATFSTFVALSMSLRLEPFSFLLLSACKFYKSSLILPNLRLKK